MLWDTLERCYAKSLSGSGMGAPAKSGRIAYGALLVKESLGLTDEETAEQIQANPYLQYFPGLEEFCEEPLFDPSIRVRFRSCFSQEHHWRISERVIALATAGKEVQDQPPSHGRGFAPNLLGELDSVDSAPQVWVSDTTNIGTEEGWVYLAVRMRSLSKRHRALPRAVRLHRELL